ncbi:MAG: hypothetical protein IT381_16505 [Deltaproteobacteria bacterium]|nr:hypothetical protein [Deltaproteobacteria bacterium]
MNGASAVRRRLPAPALPSRTALIRNDVPGPFAKDLENIVLPELADHIAKWDPHPNSTKGGGVWN